MVGYNDRDVLGWRILDPLPPIREGATLDSIVCLNVLEHIEDDAGALANARQILAPSGGRLVLLVPAHPGLYGPLDRKVGHLRRYTRAGLERALRAAGFRVETLRWFNASGMPGWWLNSRLLGRDRLPAIQVSAFDVISRIALPLERWIGPPTGLSLFAVATPDVRDSA